jgi:hypothetical protein
MATLESATSTPATAADRSIATPCAVLTARGRTRSQDGAVVNVPSGATGERAVGNALLVVRTPQARSGLLALLGRGRGLLGAAVALRRALGLSITLAQQPLFALGFFLRSCSFRRFSKS